MIRKVKVVVEILLLVVVVAKAVAEQSTFTIVSNTRVEIDRIYQTPPPFCPFFRFASTKFKR